MIMNHLQNNTDQMISLNNNNNGDHDSIEFRLKSKFIYIGKIKNEVPLVIITQDRFMFRRLYNPSLNERYNISVPFTDITAIRYCFTKDISVIIIQPTYDSYEKLSNWLNKNNLPLSRIIPENFILISLEDTLEEFYLNRLERFVLTSNNKIKFIEINSHFAYDYLNKPNKTLNIRDSSVGTKNQEVIILDEGEPEESDSEDQKKESVEELILSKEILRYPQISECKSIALYGVDLKCLGAGQYINDNIMNFYLKYFQYNGHVSQEIVDKIYIYDVLFMTQLLHKSNVAPKRKFTLDNNCVIRFSSPSDSLEHSFQNLKKWTKDIDIFAKDFLLVPFLKNSHWFLVILCYIGNLTTMNDPKNNSVVRNINEAIKKPTVIVMDSLYTKKSLTHFDIQSINSYIRLELKEKRGIELKRHQQINKILFPKVPQQRNYYDCGLFVLEYIERFLKEPEEIFMKIINDNKALENWFPINTLNNKRTKIQQIILNMLSPDIAKKLESELIKQSLLQET